VDLAIAHGEEAFSVEPMENWYALASGTPSFPRKRESLFGRIPGTGKETEIPAFA
jgi:hypothetical protein